MVLCSSDNLSNCWILCIKNCAPIIIELFLTPLPVNNRVRKYVKSVSRARSFLRALRTHKFDTFYHSNQVMERYWFISVSFSSNSSDDDDIELQSVGLENVSCGMWDVYNWAYTIYMYGVIFKYWKDRLFIWTVGSTKNRILRVKIRRLSTLKLKLKFFGSTAFGSWPCVRFST